MEIKKGNLFALDKSKYAFVECISLDCATGAGIALEFEKQFPGLREELRRIVRKEYLDVPDIIATKYNGETIVICLITKERFWHRPTYENFYATIDMLLECCLANDIKNLAIPRLGCNLDRLSWIKVRDYIEKTFKDTDINIQVRYLR